MAIPPIASELHFMRLARACLGKTAQFLRNPQHQVRNSGSPGCHQAARTLEGEFRKVCGNASVEEFWLRPKVLWFVGRVVAVCGALGAILSVFLTRYYGPGSTFLVYVGALLCVAALIYAAVAYVFFSSALDWLFPRRPGYNVVAHLEPAGRIEQQIVLVGHHDSPYAFWFLQRFGSPGTALFFAGALGFVWILGYSACLTGRQLVSSQLHVPSVFWSVVTLVACLPLPVLYLMFMHKVSPGAGDNLNSSFMALTIARYFARERRQGRPLKRTRLVLLSTDGEELGQRGAKAYVRRHRSDMTAMGTYVLNMDTVVHPDDLMILRSDRNGTVRLSEEMVSDVSAGANWLGIALTPRWLPPGGGGTDAAPFAAEGITTTAIIGTSMAIWSWGHEYHTTRDRVPTINAAAVRDMLMIAAEYIRRKDA